MTFPGNSSSAVLRYFRIFTFTERQVSISHFCKGGGGGGEAEDTGYSGEPSIAAAVN